MAHPVQNLRQRLSSAVAAAFGADADGVDLALHRSQHADYQADIALALARKVKRPPRDVAAAIVEKIDTSNLIEKLEISGPGFINIGLSNAALAQGLAALSADPRLGVEPAAHSETVAIDYSSPNVAKEMHVGHLRSTIIGDALARVLEFQGHTVLRQNHIGDWGTPFGMLIEHLIDEEATGQAAASSEVADLGAFYRQARAKFGADPAFAERSRLRVVKLQAGDAETLSLWRRLIEISAGHFGTVYSKLGITLRPEHIAGESMYNDALPAVVADLEKNGMATLSDGAMCVFLPEFTGREAQPVPLIIRKQDGGYGYATTDLAALRYRVGTLKANRIIIVVGLPQAQHLAMVFAAGRKADWAPASVRLEHVAFGSVLSQDPVTKKKEMFKSRSGETVSLLQLLDEAVIRARKVVDEKSLELPEEERQAIAEAVGIGAVKYADLANDRIKDYVFDWDRMLSFEGNTAPYLMYAHARIRSILRKATEDGGPGPGSMAPVEAAERALALELLDLGEAVARTGESLQPHKLCGYLHGVAMAFTSFYEKCSVLKGEGARPSRLALAELTARVLAQGLDLLGIGSPTRM